MQKYSFLALLSFFFLTAVLTTCDTVGQTVYVTKTGSKYHAAGCRYLRSSSIAISLTDAKTRDYGPCSVCRPPTTTAEKEEHQQVIPQTSDDKEVLICMSRSAYAYHSHQCSGLQRCTHEVKKILKSEAIEWGYRACKICY